MDWQRIAIRLVALAGLSVSAAGLVDHFRSASLFCGFDGDCHSVIASPFGSLLGLPVAAWGLIGFGVTFLLSFFSRASAWMPWLGVLAGLVGAGLLFIQAYVLKQFCSLCLVADACGLLLALVALARPMRAWEAERNFGRNLWLMLTAFALALPVAWSLWNPPPPVPEEVKQYWQRDKLNFVLVTDFDCQSCRQTHPLLDKLLHEQADRVHFVLLVHPLPKNKNSRPAARAYFFAKEQGKEKEMGEALFAADDLSPEGCAKIVSRLGLDATAYTKFLAESGLDERIDAATAWAPKTGLRGLPLLWIGEQTLVGGQSEAALKLAMTR